MKTAAAVLESYFFELYNVFMKKLASFMMSEESTPEDAEKLSKLLAEIIRIKGKMQK